MIRSKDLDWLFQNNQSRRYIRTKLNCSRNNCPMCIFRNCNVGEHLPNRLFFTQWTYLLCQFTGKTTATTIKPVIEHKIHIALKLCDQNDWKFQVTFLFLQKKKLLYYRIPHEIVEAVLWNILRLRNNLVSLIFIFQLWASLLAFLREIVKIFYRIVLHQRHFHKLFAFKLNLLNIFRKWSWFLSTMKIKYIMLLSLL